jgi:hypothetical protein
MQIQHGALVISLDFELIWGIRDLETTEQHKNIIVTRQVILRLLDLFRKYEIHVTWATVGFLFFDSKSELLSNLPKHTPTYVNNNLSPYNNLTEEIGFDEENDPIHYAPSLIRKIQETPHQELATHTFSHYYCLEEGQTSQHFESDLQSAVHVGKKHNCKIQSIVFPRNQYSEAYLKICAENGITSFRGNELIWFRASSSRKEHRHWSRRLLRLLDAYINISGTNAYKLPTLSNTLPVNIPASRYLRAYSKRLAFLEPLRLQRITTAMKKSAQEGQVFHLWWHPEDFSSNMEENLKILEKILIEYSQLREKYNMKSLTMNEIANQVLIET